MELYERLKEAQFVKTQADRRTFRLTRPKTARPEKARKGEE